MRWRAVLRDALSVYMAVSASRSRSLAEAGEALSAVATPALAVCLSPI